MSQWKVGEIVKDCAGRDVYIAAVDVPSICAGETVAPWSL